jgi:protein SCO1/2
VILMDADGRFAGTIDMHEPRETVLAKLRRLIDA